MMERIQTEFGFVVPLGETAEVSTSILEILPRKKISKHFHKKTKEIEVILRGEAIVNGKRRKKSEVLIWEPGEQHAHEYYNDSSDTVRVLCVSIPKYDPADSYECNK
jgi:uncharacterized cupin superfamily protein